MASDVLGAGWPLNLSELKMSRGLVTVGLVFLFQLASVSICFYFYNFFIDYWRKGSDIWFDYSKF